MVHSSDSNIGLISRRTIRSAHTQLTPTLAAIVASLGETAIGRRHDRLVSHSGCSAAANFAES
jgi:hypothetical protein